MYEPNRQRDPEADKGSVVPEIGRAGLRIALLMILPALAMLLLVPRHSPEFVILGITLGIGIVFMLLVLGTVWFINRRL